MDIRQQRPKHEDLLPAYYELADDIESLLIKNSIISLIYIDCSKFNKIEKIFGKKIYNDLLMQIKNILLDMKGKNIRNNDIITSMAPESDEFLIFLDTKREDKTFIMTDLESLCDRVSSHLKKKFFQITLPYLRSRHTISVGYAVMLHNPIIEEKRLINKLIEDAKVMSQYKEFKRLMRNKEKIQELIMKEAITTFFQPIVNFKDNEIVGFEALSRGPEGSEYESPYMLFDAAAEAELIFELDRLCRNKALINAMSMDPRYKLFINCFPSAIHDPEFRDTYLESSLNELGIKPSNVVLEITEKEAIENFRLFKEAVLVYSELGFAIAVDDTGTGYSGLETLVELKPDFVKIDISIVRDIDTNIVKQELTKAILALSKKMNSVVIAEGIETKEELLTLKKIGINVGQGYLFAKPGPAFPEVKF